MHILWSYYYHTRVCDTQLSKYCIVYVCINVCGIHCNNNMYYVSSMWVRVWVVRRVWAACRVRRRLENSSHPPEICLLIAVPLLLYTNLQLLFNITYIRRTFVNCTTNKAIFKRQTKTGFWNTIIYRMDRPDWIRLCP